jgi:hypothetical protein
MKLKMFVSLSSLRRLCLLLVLLVLIGPMSACSLPQVSAEERLFLNLSLDFLGETVLPKNRINGVPVGGISGITYDRRSDRFFAVSDDRSDLGPARFYQLKLNLDGSNPQSPKLGSVAVEKVVTVTAPDGNPYAKGTVDLEGIAMSPRQSVFISSEGVADQGIAPFINEYDLESGQLKGQLPVPERFVPKVVEGQPRGVLNNLGFEALTLNLPGFTPNGSFLEPFRLFAATESAIAQDLPPERPITPETPTATPAPETPPPPIPVRLLHYLIGDTLPTLLAEHLYLLEPSPPLALGNGLTEILVLDQGGHFLSLERVFGPQGFDVRVYQFVIGSATDTSGFTALRGDLEGIQPVRKQLLLDLKELGIKLDNLEGMTLGPRLPDGSQSLVLVSDDNFGEGQKTQFLLFRLKSPRPLS